MQANYAAAPTALANTGVNTGMLLVGLLFLAFGGLLTLVLRRKQG
jgi:LPXTG-motif cell wall-anchored protein